MRRERRAHHQQEMRRVWMEQRLSHERSRRERDQSSFQQQDNHPDREGDEHNKGGGGFEPELFVMTAMNNTKPASPLKAQVSMMTRGHVSMVPQLAHGDDSGDVQVGKGRGGEGEGVGNADMSSCLSNMSNPIGVIVCPISHPTQEDEGEWQQWGIEGRRAAPDIAVSVPVANDDDSDGDRNGEDDDSIQLRDRNGDGRVPSTQSPIDQPHEHHQRSQQQQQQLPVPRRMPQPTKDGLVAQARRVMAGLRWAEADGALRQCLAEFGPSCDVYFLRGESLRLQGVRECMWVYLMGGGESGGVEDWGTFPVLDSLRTC